MITFNNAVCADATNRGAVFGDLAQVRFTTAMSFSMWIKLNASFSGAAGAFGKGNGINGCYFSFVQTNRKLRFYTYFSSGSGYTLSSATDVSSSVWQHWVGIKDATQQRLYLNATLDNSYSGTPSSNIFSSSQPLIVGGWTTSGTTFYTWPGQIFDLRLYNRVLTTTEMTMIRDAKGRDGITSGLALRTCIGDGCVGIGSLSGKKVYDHSSNRAVSTVVGSHTSVIDPYDPFPTEDA